VLQIAAHEQVIPVERLYEICRIARKHADAYRIGRVIARPFVGEPGNFTRTARRHDFSMPPPRTVLNALSEAGTAVKSIGKISDLFAGSGIAESHPTECNAEGMRATAEIWRDTRQGLIFTNLVDFDTMFGHRRDVEGYAAALAEFDRWLADFLPLVTDDDLFIVTADHGNDPTFRGTDHTRERVPLMMKFRGRTGDLGVRGTFADVAATLLRFFEIGHWPVGRSLLESNYETRHDDVSAHPTRRPLARRRADRGADGRGGPERGGLAAGGADGEPHRRREAPGSRDLRQPRGARAADGGRAR
jgi:phosphopentomutase